MVYAAAPTGLWLVNGTEQLGRSRVSEGSIMKDRRKKLQQRGDPEDLESGRPPGANGSPASPPDVPGVGPRLSKKLATLRRWEEGILFGLVVAVVLGAFAVWGVIMLSAGVPLDVKKLATGIIVILSAGLFSLLRKRMNASL